MLVNTGIKISIVFPKQSRDIKPDNFLVGKDTSDSGGINEKSSVIHMVDFGLAKPFIDADTGRHIPYSENRSICGTLRYISPNVHKVSLFNQISYLYN